MPRVNYPPRVRRILAAVLESINAQGPVLPDGSNRPLKLRLAQRSEMKLSIEPSGGWFGPRTRESPTAGCGRDPAIPGAS